MKEQIEGMEMTPLDVLANDINQHCPDLAENYCGDTHCVACLANALYNAGYRKQEWIRVYDRLPEPNVECLVAAKVGNRMVVDFGERVLCFDYCKMKHLYEWAITNDWDDGEACEITHWMPLPEPPKMKGGGE